ncbi:Transcription factor GTE10 [Acorus calamus]|uniref:Transcription factor GTE10 n=1 Tax=Acorus calamus TaxID=4465 RepID=A0AAV9CNY1_ACOCL|nr:Transcription factor GTE10 [Acorus calamus]
MRKCTKFGIEVSPLLILDHNGSDSGSSSGSESVGARAQTPTNTSRETLGPVSALDMEKSNLMNPPDGNRSISGSGKIDTSTHTNAVPVEVDNSRDGENAPPERQVSPDKLYRAALLRNRFADTILKAREKTLDQKKLGCKQKLKQQRMQEDKLKQKLLLKLNGNIERTVEINENSKFLKDLEMLRAAPGGTMAYGSTSKASEDKGHLASPMLTKQKSSVSGVVTNSTMENVRQNVNKPN